MININLLPKNLRRRREPGYWRLIAVLFPLLVLLVVGVIDIAARQNIRRLEDDRNLRQLELSRLQADVAEQRRLQARLAQLQELINVRNAVQEGRILWSSELFSMLETLPPQGNAPRPRIAFNTLNLRALDPGTQQNYLLGGTYGDLAVTAEMLISGTAVTAEVLSEYLRALEDSPIYGARFSNATRETETGFYTFNLTVGAVTADLSQEASTPVPAPAAPVEGTP